MHSLSLAENEDVNTRTDMTRLKVRTYRHDDHGQRIHVTLYRHLFLLSARSAMFRGQVAGYLTTDVANVETGASRSVDENVRL